MTPEFAKTVQTASLIACFGIAGCSVPPNGVLLFDGTLPDGIEAVDPDWNGRIIQVASVGGTTGGRSDHDHLLSHSHLERSERAGRTVAPLGLTETAAGQAHTHMVQSTGISVAATSASEMIPPSYQLTAGLVPEGLAGFLPQGLVVGYIGDGVPKGWRLADGTHGAPDLVGRYIMIAQQSGPTGNASHSHGLSHGHSWRVSSATDDFGFLKDGGNPSPPFAVASSRTHGHPIARSGHAFGTTGLAPNDPPFVAFQFIQLVSDQMRQLPKGAVVAFDRRSPPLGWQRLEIVIGNEVLGRLVRAGEQITVGGSLSHGHTASHRHRVDLGPAVETGPRDSQGPNLEIPTSDHRHQTTAVFAGDTAPSAPLPPFVSLLIAVRR